MTLTLKHEQMPGAAEGYINWCVRRDGVFVTDFGKREDAEAWIRARHGEWSEWRPASGHPSGRWRCVRTRRVAPTLMQHENAKGLPVLFASAKTAQVRCDQLNRGVALGRLLARAA